MRQVISLGYLDRVKTTLKVLIFSLIYWNSWGYSQLIEHFLTHFDQHAHYHQKNLTIDYLSDEHDITQTNTTISSKSWKMKLSAGLLQNTVSLSEDAVTLLICHEMGHFLGGYPFFDDMMAEREFPSASEGQADYYATQVCARELWQNEDNREYKKQVLTYAKTKCDQAWENDNEKELCYRIAVALDNLKDLLSEISQTQVALETPDPHVSNYTINWAYPKTQCRLDTFFAGSLCNTSRTGLEIPGLAHPKGQSSKAAEQEAMAQSCYDGLGQRPKCWFKRRESR